MRRVACHGAMTARQEQAVRFVGVSLPTAALGGREVIL